MKHSQNLPLAPSPESVGLSSKRVLRFLDRIRAARINMHGVLIARHGAVAAEGYWAPYTSESLHRMYSISKSFVALAVGLLAEEGQLSLDDPIIQFFPDKLPDPVPAHTAASTVRDLLMMASAHNGTTYTPQDTDWVKTFFHKPPIKPPGQIFVYDTSSTVVLSALVERLSGMPLLEYLRPRLLDPIGFSEDAWCIQTPEGISWGGSGLMCRLRDLAKVALVCLNSGRWGDQQLVSEAFIREATGRQIDNALPVYGGEGYGYQIWRMKNNGFSFRGLGAQFALGFPDRDFLFACVADLQGNDPAKTELLSVFWQELYDGLEDKPLPENPEANKALSHAISELAMLPLESEANDTLATDIHGRWYELEENPMNISRMRFLFETDAGTWEYVNAQGENRLRFGLGRLVADAFPQKNYFGDRIGTRPGIQYACLSSAAWVEPHKLNLKIWITDNYLGHVAATFAFREHTIAIQMTKEAEWFLDEYQGFAVGRCDKENGTIHAR